jgi:hypothetical protein
MNTFVPMLSIVIEFFYWRKKKRNQKWRRWTKLEVEENIIYFLLQKLKRIFCVLYMYIYISIYMYM